MKALIMTVAAAGALMLAGQAGAVDAKAAEGQYNQIKKPD